MYNSQYYTCEQIDERLLQGYLDDYNTQTGQSLTKAQFLTKLGSIFSKEGVIDDTATQIQNVSDNGMCFYKAVTFNDVISKRINLQKSIILQNGSYLEITGNISNLEQGSNVAVFFRTSDNTYIQKFISATGDFTFQYKADEDIEIVEYGINMGDDSNVVSGEAIFTINLIPDFYNFLQKQIPLNEKLSTDSDALIGEVFDFFKNSSVGYIGTDGTITHVSVSENIVTDYIPVEEGQVFRYRGSFNNNPNISMVWGYDANKANPVILVDSTDGVINTLFSIPSGVSFICAWSHTLYTTPFLADVTSLRGRVNNLEDIINSVANIVDTSNIAKNGTAASYRGFIVNKSYIAPANGVIRKLYFYSPLESNAIKVCTCTKNAGDEFTVKSVYSYTLRSIGMNEISVEIPVSAGDYLGLFISTVENMLPYSNTQTDGWYWQQDSSVADLTPDMKIPTTYLPNYSSAYGFIAIYANDDIVTETIVATRNQDNYNSIREIISGLTASEKYRYIIYVPNGEWFECDLQGKKYVEIVGQDRDSTIIYCDGTSNKVTPSDYSYNGKGNTALSSLEQSFKHVFYLKNDCVVRNLTIKANNCKYCVHMDDDGYNYALFENCVFYDFAGCNHPVGIGAHSGQDLNMIGCIFRCTDRKTGTIIHNWNNQAKPTSILIQDSLFDNCGFINIDELGSGQSDDWRLINCFSNIGGFLTFTVDIANGKTYYTNPSTGQKESNPQAVPYSIKLNCLGSNVVSCRPLFFNGDVQAISRPDFAKYLITDHYIKMYKGSYNVGSVVRKVLDGNIGDSFVFMGVVEYIIDNYAYVAKDTAWLSQSAIQGTASVGASVYEDLNGMVTVESTAKNIGKIIAFDSTTGLYQISMQVANELALDGVYDVSAKNPTAGPNNDGKFTLAYILDQNNVNTLIPTAVRKGGMSIKFIQSSDNKYVQYMYDGTSTSDADFINVGNWEKVNLEKDLIDIFNILPNIEGLISYNFNDLRHIGFINTQGIITSPTNTPWRYSDFIPVLSSTKLACNLSNGSGIAVVAFYSSDNESSFVSYWNGNTGQEVSSVVPAGANYLRFCSQISKIDAYLECSQINTNSKRLVNIENTINNIEPEVDVLDETLDIDTVTRTYDKILTDNDFTVDGYYVKTDGTLTSGPAWKSTPFISILPNTTITAKLSNGSGNAVVAFYSSDNESSFISYWNGNTGQEVSSVVPLGANYFRASTGKGFLIIDNPFVRYKQLITKQDSKRLLNIEEELTEIGSEQEEITKIETTLDLGDNKGSEQLVIEDAAFTVSGYYVKTDGTLTPGPAWKSTSFIFVKSLSKIECKLNNGSGNAVVAFYSSDNESSFISYWNGNTGDVVSENVPSGANYFRACTRKDGAAIDNPYVKYFKPVFGSGTIEEIKESISDIEDDIEDINSKLGPLNTGKSWCSIGDSITWLNDNIGGRPLTKGYQDVVREKLTFTNFYNRGLSGYTAIGYSADSNLNNLEVADFYTIFLGINDWGNTNLSLVGTFADYKNFTTGSATNYAEAIKKIIDKCKALNPNSVILLFTPRRGKNFDGFLPSSSLDPNNAGIYLHQFADIIREVSEYEGLPLIDLYYHSGVNDANLTAFSYDNALHPNDAGMRIIGQMLYDKMKDFVL